MIWLLFILVGVFNVSMIYLGETEWATRSKPFLMPPLMLALIIQTHLKTNNMRWLLAGVVFGWMGDLFLMQQGSLFFALGLFSFLIGHLIYICVFAQEVIEKKKSHYIMEKAYWILPYIALWIFCVILLSKHIEDFPVFPIYLYAFVIFLMSITAINRWNAVSKSSWWLVFLGSLFFIISDLSLSVKTFITPFENSSLLIMSTYILGQGLIVYGCFKNFNK